MLAALKVFLLDPLKFQLCDFYREEIKFNYRALVKER